MKEIYCSECGEKNKSSSIRCEYCGSTLKTDKIVKGKAINSFDDLITEENIQQLVDTPFTQDAYKSILEEIIRRGYDNFHYDVNASVLDNVYQLAEQYTHVYAKHKGNDSLGLYSANNIYLDERMPEAQKISTLIHELTHHLYYEIYEQWLMYTYKIEKNKYLEAFILFVLNRPELKTFNEYIAHTTQARYEEAGCQSYSSFIDLRTKYALDMMKLTPHFDYGRSVSDDITMIIECFISENVKQKIIQQFDMDNMPKIYEVNFDDLPRMSEKDKIESMHAVLINSMMSAFKSKDIMDYLKTFDQYFI